MFIYIFLGLLLLIAIVMTVLFIFKSQNGGSNKLKHDLQNFKKIFQGQENKKIRIDDFDYVEIFNKFPFLSNFNETNKKFTNTNLIETLSKMQINFYNYWANKEYDFFIIFEKISKRTNASINQEAILKVYNLFAQESFDIYKAIFIKTVFPALICKIQNKPYKLTDVNRIDELVDKEYLNFCKQIDDLLVKLENNILFNNNNNNNNRQYNSNNNYSNQSVNSDIINAYKVLGVRPSDSDDKIKKAYRKLAKEFHPDRNKTEFAKKKMAEINDAYDKVMKDRETK